MDNNKNGLGNNFQKDWRNVWRIYQKFYLLVLFFYVFYAYLKYLGDYYRKVLKQLMLMQTYLLDVLYRFLWYMYSYITSYSNNTFLKM